MELYEALAEASGPYAFSIDLGFENLVPAVDPRSGAKTINPIVIAGDGQTRLLCPRAGGAKSWLPASHDAGTKIV